MYDWVGGCGGPIAKEGGRGEVVKEVGAGARGESTMGTNKSEDDERGGGCLVWSFCCGGSSISVHF